MQWRNLLDFKVVVLPSNLSTPVKFGVSLSLCLSKFVPLSPQHRPVSHQTLARFVKMGLWGWETASKTVPSDRAGTMSMFCHRRRSSWRSKRGKRISHVLRVGSCLSIWTHTSTTLSSVMQSHSLHHHISHKHLEHHHHRNMIFVHPQKSPSPCALLAWPLVVLPL